MASILRQLSHHPFQNRVPLTRMASSRAYSLSSFLVKPSDLHEALKHNPRSSLSTSPRVIPLCASWFLPNDPQKRTGLEVFKKGHIPSARFFDLDAVSDTSSPYPHMLPDAATFSKAVSELGIRRDDSVVVYDSAEAGIFSAPRVAWTFRVFGHDEVHILNNFKIYVEEGYPVEEGEQEQIAATTYHAPELRREKVVAFEEVKEIARDYNKEGSEGVQILDARSAGRWAGTDPEPRPGLSSGHIPGSFSVPVPELLDPVTKAFLPKEKLRAVFESKGIDPNKPIVSSCGTGVTAAVIDAALTECGVGTDQSRKIYDGSWTEWAQRVEPRDGLIVRSS